MHPRGHRGAKVTLEYQTVDIADNLPDILVSTPTLKSSEEEMDAYMQALEKYSEDALKAVEECGNNLEDLDHKLELLYGWNDYPPSYRLELQELRRGELIERRYLLDVLYIVNKIKLDGGNKAIPKIINQALAYRSAREYKPRGTKGYFDLELRRWG